MHSRGFGRFHIITIFGGESAVIAYRNRYLTVFKGHVNSFFEPLPLPGVFFQIADKYSIADIFRIFAFEAGTQFFITLICLAHRDMENGPNAMKYLSQKRCIFIIIKAVPGIKHGPIKLDLFCPAFSFFFRFRHTVQWKNINKNTAVISRLFIFFIAAAGLAVSDLGVAAKVIFLCIHSLEHQIFFQPFRGNLHKFIIIFPQHYQVNIVIPWNISFMADGTDQGSAVSKIFKAIGFADALHFI